VAPKTTINAVGPDPNNGFVSGPGSVAYLNEERVHATFDDTGNQSSMIAMAEVFISQPGVLPWCYDGPARPPISPCASTPPAGFFGTGAEMVPVGARWNQSAVQEADAFIPLADVRAFAEGHVWFWVHSQDQAGNWGPFADGAGKPIPSSYYAMTLDKTAPVIDSTGVGDPVLEALQKRGGSYAGYKFTATSKQQLMERLAVAIQQRHVGFPDGVIVSELEAYEYVYSRTGVHYSAPEGLHDDCVCSLALAVWQREAGGGLPFSGAGWDEDE